MALGPVRLVTALPPSTPRGGLSARWLVALAVFVLAGIMATREAVTRHRLASLPEHDRQNLYSRAVSTLRENCADQQRSETRPLCIEQANLVIRLPECDAACRGLALAVHGQPTK